MPGNRFYFFLFLVGLIFSCEEEEGALITNPSVYHKSGIEPVGNFRVFSSTGEIKDNAVINRLGQYDTAFYRGYSQYIGSGPGIMDTVYFFKERHAILNHEYKNLVCLFNVEGNQILLTETKATSKCCYSGEVFTRSLPYYLATSKPEVESEFIFSSDRGYYSFGFIGRRKYVLSESNGQLVAPLILYTQHSTRYALGYVNDFLQPDFYSNLAVGDTVTLMEYTIHFEK